MIVLGHMIFSAYIRKQFRGKETKREFLKMEAATAEERFVVVVDFTVLIISRRYMIIEVLYFIWTASYWLVE